MTEGVWLGQLVGEVFLERASKRQRVQKPTKLKDRDVIETGRDSYVVSLSDNPAPESGKRLTMIFMFPNSRVVVYLGRGYIREVEIVSGLVGVSTDKRVFTPTAEWTGGGWAQVAPDGRTVVAYTRATVSNRRTLRAAILQGNDQVLVTEDGVGEPEPMDQRFAQAQRTWEQLGKSLAAAMYEEMAKKSARLYEASLESLKVIAEKTGRDFGEMKEEARRSFAEQERWLESEAEKLRQEGARSVERDLSAAPTVIPVNQVVRYQGIDFQVVSVKREAATGEGSLLSVNIEARSESDREVFIFYGEEVRLVNEKGESFPTDDYNLETNFTRGTRSKGCLFIRVNEEDTRFILQFGKKSLPKVELELDLSAANKEGD